MSKISALPELNTPADGDYLEIVDVSDTSQAATGTNKKIPKADLVASAPPAAHAVQHENGGIDEIVVTGLSGVLADPQVADKVLESAGPTTLDIGAIVDGEFLKRVGTDIVSASVPGGAEAGANSDITSMDGLTGALENPTQIIFPEAAAPSTPGAAKVTLYAKSDGLLYSKDDAGAETLVSGGAGGGSIAPLVVEDANTVAQRNTSNAQTSYLYETTDGGSNFSRLRTAYDGTAGSFILNTQQGGSPTLRTLKIVIGATLTNGFVFQNSNFSALTDNAYALGSSGVRWSTTFTTNLNLAAAGSVVFAGRGAISTPASNIIRLSDASLGDTSGMGLSFGGTSSNSPMFKRVSNTASLELKVADDSTYARFTAKSLRSNPVTVANLPTSPLEGMLVAVTDSSTATWGDTITGGGANKVLAYYNGTNWTVAAK